MELIKCHMSKTSYLLFIINDDSIEDNDYVIKESDNEVGYQFSNGSDEDD